MPAPSPSPSKMPARSKKTRIVRRRGRANDAVASDDEIEREIATDSDSEDGQSSFDSASDSDTEPASDDVIPNGHTRILTPSMSQSPQGASLLDTEISVKTVDQIPVATSFFGTTGNWSDMVTDETANGPADLPVVDFADFDAHALDASRSRNPEKSAKRLSGARTSSAPPSSTREDQTDDPQPVASTSKSTHESAGRRPPGQSARQAYQQRLETDPSYVPTVGEFWGHDDRLLDKDLRSLSGWWRGKWQGRARGRGSFDRGFSTRGRGPSAAFGTHEQNGESIAPEVPNPDLPAIERTWGHDGFEEMKRREENRRPNHVQSQPLRGGPFRGRGGLRGGLRSVAFPHSATSPPRGDASNLSQGRVWFVMKPERVWTKQHDGFLHFDPALKPRPGQGPGLIVKLPGTVSQVIRAAPRVFSAPRHPVMHQRTASVIGSEEGDKVFVVHLPKPRAPAQAISEPGPSCQPAAAEPFTTMEAPPMDDVFTVRPQLQTRTPIIPSTLAIHSQPSTAPSVSAPLPPDPPKPVDPSPTEANVADTNGQRWTQIEEAVLNVPSRERSRRPSAAQEHPAHPVVPPIQTTFSPSPPTPYNHGYAYHTSLPPGIAMDQHGMPYEIATGRPVYLQPPTMYNPRPVMHPMPYAPGHTRHHSSMTPDFSVQGHMPSHTPPMNAFVDGPVSFSLPRQSSQLEIRPPTNASDGKAPSKTNGQRSSSLRGAASAFEPAQDSIPNGHQEYPQIQDHHGVPPSYASVDGEGSQMPQMDPAILAYSPFQQQYYYPDAYGYPQYMVHPYEAYAPDPRAAASQVYY